MRQPFLTFIVALGSFLSSQNATALHARLLSQAEIVGRQLVVGRAHCAGSTWLLTESLELTRVSHESHIASTSPLRGLRQDEKPWGLACLSNGELWTLATPHALARLTADGHLIERIRLDRPRLGIYSAGDRLLLQDPPAAIGTPLLAVGLPRSGSTFARWPAPVSRHALSAEEQLRSNFVSCGIGAANYVPCWLVNDVRLAIGDGLSKNTIVRELRFARAPAGNDGAIWDVALAGSSRVWVLTSARAGIGGLRLGGRLTRSTRLAEDDGSVDLNPPARLIMWAADDRCVLLSASGQLLEVSAP